MSLPPLPNPVIPASELVESSSGVFAALYLREQMQAYGQQCREVALEEAAAVIEADIYPAPLTAYQVQYNAGISLRVSKIRSLK